MTNTITIPRAWLEGLKERAKEVEEAPIEDRLNAVNYLLGYIESAEVFSSREV